MKISGFTFIKNAVKYDFPIVECVNSIIDIVDEFIIVAGDSDDKTDELLETIKSPKVKVIKSTWDTKTFNKRGTIFAQQTDLALKACSGDWAFYIQSDEVFHEDGKEVVRTACEKYLKDERVEGFIFNYIHIYGDYQHYIDARHFGYPREIRIIRNKPGIHSWKDAQSFRYIPDFDGKDYYVKEGTRKLHCILLNATMFHYGWARDPRAMAGKIEHQNIVYTAVCTANPDVNKLHDYGNLNYFPLLRHSHPKAMEDRINHFSWGKYIRFEGARIENKKIFGLKYRILKFIEGRFMSDGETVGGFKNYKKIGIYGYKKH
ncbi:MAG: glycosyltransferase family 2 protein [Rikenellaceae bacterium]